jgi:hypothetical protein
MIDPVAVILFTLFFILMVWIVFAFICFDRLLRHQITHYPENWAGDGQPSGFFYFPRRASYASAYWARNRCLKKWVSQTPSWAQEDEKAFNLLRRLRNALLTYLIGFLIFVFLAVFVLIPNLRHE